MSADAAPWRHRLPAGRWLALAKGGASLGLGLAMAMAMAMAIALSVGAGAGNWRPAGLPLWLLWLLLVPLLEEAVFRVGLQDALLRHGWRPWLANGCTALCFTACHVLLRGAGWASWAVVVPALLLGVVYSRSRQLRGCVALHALMNAGWMAAQQLAPP